MAYWSKSLFCAAMMIVVVMSESRAQNICGSALTSLNVCAPFVVPGATTTTPSSDCCGALQGVDHACLCSTLRIAARIPAQCNLPPLSCAN